MTEVVITNGKSLTKSEYRVQMAEHLRAIDLLRDEMLAQQSVLDNLKLETDALKPELNRLFEVSKANLSRLGASL